MPKITNEQKMEAIKAFLDKNGYVYEENHVSKWCRIVIPLAVKNLLIAVHIGDDEAFYEATKGKYFPVFIRDEDTKAKVIEKMENTIIKSMIRQQRRLLKRKGQ